MKFIDLQKQQKSIRKNLDLRIKKVLDHGRYILGPEISEFEKKLSIHSNSKYCITCSSGTDALLMLLMANNVGVGDAVLTTPFTYIATAGVIRQVGATPVFVDIYSETFNLNPSKIEEAIQYAQRKNLIVKAIIPVDLFGLPARYRLINEISKKYKLIVIGDSAQGYGGKIRNKMVTYYAHCSATSFFPAKPLGCYGDGGAIFTDDEDLSNKLVSIRTHGFASNKYDNIRNGINGRLDTIQAAILIEKLKIFDDELVFRNQIAKRYSDNISDRYKKPLIPYQYFSSWAQYSILLPDYYKRDKLKEKLASMNIPTMIYYPIPLHMQTVFKNLGYAKGDFPISENVSKKILSLPMHPYLNKKQQDQIIDALNNFNEN